MPRTIHLILGCFLLLCACAPMQEPSLSAPSPTPSDQAYAPQPGDQSLSRSKFFLNKEETSILTLAGQPARFAVSLKGSLPTPCHQPRIVVNPPDGDNKILVEAYSVVDPNRVCAEMIQLFEGQIPLGNLPKGHYSVWVNGEKIGEIDG